MLPRTLKNFSLFVDGIGYAGRVTEMTPPTLTVKTEEYRAGGMDAPIELDMGMEAMEASFTLAEYNENVLQMFGLQEVNPRALIVRGALQRNTEAAAPMVITMNGNFKEFDPGSLVAGEVTEASFTVALTYYKMEVNTITVHEIDIENMTRVIGGADQLQIQRTQMGI